jgi:putative ABC transport system permease protein
VGTRRAVVMVLSGIVVGVAGALAATRVLVTLLYEVKPDDLWTYVLISVLLTVVALLASYLPARRASRIDPCLTLRAE